MNDPKTRHRRYRQFSLRTFLVVLTLVCVWFGCLVNRSNRQRKAVAWVLEMRGSVQYDYEVDDAGRYLPDAKPTSPEWLRGLYDQVVGVALRDTQVHDLTPLANLNSLQLLFLNNTQVHDLTPRGNLKNLQELYLADAQVSDLTPLANLKNLEELNLSNTQVSEEQITKLQQALPNCGCFYIKVRKPS